ncbi:uncharacterized protein TRIADDRAFT_56899 [Trichoplax adhaerens]|uniref:Ras-associating domain-containing protein n=1 Tax=Trichoplax adhaerens TaxID=10228 RepID=B3RWW2_TRIAD|nr:hypothetical protein TRIADDRAFT_56899 [Trichoplax adhaerens]EDV25201.1 hypothetical protein TRIADDRAFT_56899 [Trichoplax adhaerens]|eukprot:XP_002113091.1 hypothetical protein TRIADDRAFT_56899 [Trichoplax adhaerens]
MLDRRKQQKQHENQLSVFETIFHRQKLRKSSKSKKDKKYPPLLDRSKSIPGPSFVIDQDEDTIESYHDFRIVQLTNPTWCDYCTDFIWGLFKQAIRIDLKCPRSLAKQISENHQHIVQQEQSLQLISGKANEKPGYARNTLEVLGLKSTQELKEVIQRYNQKSSGLIITMQPKSCKFAGFIHIGVDILRPVNVHPFNGKIKEQLKDSPKLGSSNVNRKRSTSFFMPSGSLQAIHVTSDTTATEIIVTFLEKYKIADNPQKFAIYERVHKLTKYFDRKLNDYERPLCLKLMWNKQNDEEKSFVIGENKTGDICWDAFSVAELENFLTILNLEEKEHINQVRTRYERQENYLRSMLETPKQD